MKAILVNQHGAPDVLTFTNIPNPEPQENEVVIKLHFSGLNHLDVWVRKGSPAYPVKLPHIMGADGAGTVEALGKGAEGVSVGDRVLIFPGISCGNCLPCTRGQDNQCVQYEILGSKRNGTYAEYVSVPDQNVVAIPDSLSFEQAASFPLVYLTAWHMMIGRAKLLPIETVLVVGGSGGIGVAAIQIAKLKGAKVLATTTARQKVNKIKSIGADDVFWDEKDSDFSKWVLQHTEMRGADIVIEHVGPATWDKSVKSLNRNGQLVTCGATTGSNVSLDLRNTFSRDLSVFGARMGTQREFQDLTTALFKDEIKPVVDKIFPLEDASSAHDYIEGRQQVGKVLLKII